MAGNEFSAAERRRLAEEGEAMPDGSFPIRTSHAEHDIHNAVLDYNRIPAGEKPAVRRWIVKRAVETGQVSELPESWHVRAK